VQEAATGTREVSGKIVRVSQAATETGTAANQLRSSAGNLEQVSNDLQHEIGTFLSAVRAA
jgi:methyl-accepting chemotaxis protein